MSTSASRTTPPSHPSATATDTPPTTALDGLKAWFEPWIGVDARGLAAFRILLGLVVASASTERLLLVPLFFSDRGIFHRRVAIEHGDAWDWSLHLMSGRAEFQYLLVAATIGCGLSLAVGYRTTTSAVAAWALWASACARHDLTWGNLHTLGVQDQLCSILLLYAAMLPAGRAWSVDAALAAAARRRQRPAAAEPPSASHLVCSAATLGLAVQVCLVYASSGGAKWLKSGE